MPWPGLRGNSRNACPRLAWACHPTHQLLGPKSRFFHEGHEGNEGSFGLVFLGINSRFLHVIGGRCGFASGWSDFQRTLMALSGERSKFESGFQEKELATLTMEGLHGACRPCFGNSGIQKHPLFMHLFRLENSSDAFFTAIIGRIPFFPPLKFLPIPRYVQRCSLNVALV